MFNLVFTYDYITYFCICGFLFIALGAVFAINSTKHKYPVNGFTISLNNYIDIIMFETLKESMMYMQKPPTILEILQSPSGLKKPVALVGRSFVDLILHKKTKNKSHSP